MSMRREEEAEEEGTVDRDILIAANQDAATYYRTQLHAPEHTGPRGYLTARGVTGLMGETVWTVGYAPAGWTNLVDHLAQLGYCDDTLLQAGLATRCRRGTLIDRFRNRLTFGIHNLAGELVGFTARCSPAAEALVPKYLNTPTTALFHKGEVLFGLDEHAEQLRAGATLVLVEGPLDAIAVTTTHDEDAPLGRSYAPAALGGTALTDTHATGIAKLITGDVIVALDDDDAGLRAAENAYLKLAHHTEKLHAPRPWKRNDPADVLQASGPAGIREHLHYLTPLGSQIITRHLATWRDLGNNAETDLAALREIAHLIATAQPRNIAPLARQLIADLALDLPTVNRELTEAAAPRRPTSARPQTNSTFADRTRRPAS